MPRTTPNIVKVLRRNLATALRCGNLDEATAVLDRLRREDPLSVETRGSELEYMLRRGHLDDAGSLASQLVDTFPTSARVHYLAGRVAYQLRDYPRACDLFAEGLRIAPHWRIRLWLGKAMTQAGRFSEAEPILVDLIDDHPRVGRDLAWLYERMEDEDRAVDALEAYLRAHDDDDFARQQLQRLRARALDPERLQEEVESLVELGEPIPLEVFPEYVERLLETGQGERAREIVAAHEAELDSRTATRMAWICHRLRAPDLAFRLYIHALPLNLGRMKFLNALESDAVRVGRVPELVEVYRSHAPDNRNLWGRIKRLQRRAEKA